MPKRHYIVGIFHSITCHHSAFHCGHNLGTTMGELLVWMECVLAWSVALVVQLPEFLARFDFSENTLDFCTPTCVIRISLLVWNENFLKNKNCSATILGKFKSSKHLTIILDLNGRMQCIFCREQCHKGTVKSSYFKSHPVKGETNSVIFIWSHILRNVQQVL
jgi:hypothetical protein